MRAAFGFIDGACRRIPVGSRLHLNPVLDLLARLEYGAGNLPAAVLGAQNDLVIAGLQRTDHLHLCR